MIRSNYIIIYFLSILVVLINSCMRYDCNDLTKHLNTFSANEKGNLEIDFKGALPFDWDILYIFDSMLYPDEVSETIGMDYNGNIVPEGRRLLVYINNDEIVNTQDSECFNLTFVNMRVNGVVKIKYEAIFKLEKKKVNNTDHYILYEISEPGL